MHKTFFFPLLSLLLSLPFLLLSKHGDCVEMSSRWSIIAFVLGLWSGAGLFALLRRHKRKWLYRMIGFDEELDQARVKERARVSHDFALLVGRVGQGLLEDLRLTAQRDEERLLKVQVAALNICNMEVADKSKNFTFWQRRTLRLAEDLDKLANSLP